MNLRLYMATGLAGAVLTALGLPLWRWVGARMGLVDEPGLRKIHLEPVPLAGGPAVLASLLIVCGAVLAQRLAPLDGHRTVLLAVLVGAAGMFLVGLVDDRFEMNAGVKLAGQLLAAGAAVALGFRVTLFGSGLLL